jgi:hypothetical protein
VKRRNVLAYGGMISFLKGIAPAVAAASADRTLGHRSFSRARPSDAAWPGAARWENLNRQVGDHLIKVKPLLADCGNVNNATCQDELQLLKNPYYVGDQPAGTQSVGWVDGWMTAPSVYAVAARTTADVVAAVNFARENRPPARHQGRRSQLPGNIGLSRFVADLDAGHERHCPARHIRRPRL